MDIISPQFNGNVTRKSWFRRPLFYILAVFAVIIIYFGWKLTAVYNSISIFGGNKNNGQVVENDPNPMPKAEPDRLDVLILGIRGDTPQEIEQEGGLLSDTMQVVSYNKKTGKVALISIPRDLSIDILGVKGKINQIYERGLEHNQGVGLAEQIISKITGIYIDKAVVFDFNAFKHIVDTIDGIDINLAKPFTEPVQWGYPFTLPAGNNHLDGQQALYYVRSRFSSSDFDRSRRQQEVMLAIKNKLAKNGYFSNPVKTTNLLTALKGDIKTDFQIWDIKDIFNLIQTFDPKLPIKNYVISSDNLLNESKTPQGEFILLPKGDNYDSFKELFKNIFNQ